MKPQNEQEARRRRKLAAWRGTGDAYPNDFRPTHLAGDLHLDHGGGDNAALEKAAVTVKLAGRLMARRAMGKAAFAHLQDCSGRMQLFIRRQDLPGGDYDGLFKDLDIGDIIGVGGVLFVTKTGELSVRVNQLRLLVKSLHPLPEKFHGLSDAETRHRRRYVDLIINRSTRELFRRRSAIVEQVRRFFLRRGFLEVETPMMQAIPGGALARPFVTHHNALDMPLYLRVAPELYLKRLVAGGFERVFEINRNFRNEGVSARHNPEFTMLEFYQAYADYRDLMDLSEELLRDLTGGKTLRYQGRDIDFTSFERMTLAESLLHHNRELNEKILGDAEQLRAAARRLGVDAGDGDGIGVLQEKLFEKTVEHELQNPTFITAFPVEVSPLSRRSDSDPALSDRFELFIAGHEVANGFSELNDPEDQAERFRRQAEHKDAGDAEAMHYDADYIRALEYGMPPAAGEGIGMDRLVMLLTDAASIRDVLLFPLLRPSAADAGS
ncbi:MAG: lysine--tRNA ligase [Gammaproteobacteria bacterium]|nr:lysine--tRNA ligase [Gammaproteobacteria bacterium]MDD9870471.1 lysine--tRNA ligase [Gammaproteobacteria bacterium]